MPPILSQKLLGQQVSMLYPTQHPNASSPWPNQHLAAWTYRYKHG